MSRQLKVTEKFRPTQRFDSRGVRLVTNGVYDLPADYGDSMCPEGQIYVPGYEKSDGTWVEGYCRKPEEKKAFTDHLPYGGKEREMFGGELTKGPEGKE